MAIKTASLPPLPQELEPLHLYLLKRDHAEPTARPEPGALVQTSLGGGLDLDQITWDYAPKAELKGAELDGWVVWWGSGATANPSVGGVKLSAESRYFSMIWPTAVARSYAVAAYKNSYQGEQLGAKRQHSTWVGAV